MEDEQVHSIREMRRNMLLLNRRKLRDEESDVRRSMGNIRIPVDCVTEIASKLKTKSATSLSELHTLKNALMDHANNIKVVLNNDGALRGLAREISGQDVRRRCAAAGCCCNLALGDSAVGVAIAKAAGPYLVASLDNFTTELVVTCAWTVGNAAGSGPHPASLLSVQGATHTLTRLLHNTSEDIREAAAYALLHFAYQMKDNFGTEHMNNILSEISQQPITRTTSQLLFTLSCHKEFPTFNITQEFLNKILECLTVSMEMHLTTCKIQPCCQLMSLLRFLANMDSIILYDYVLEYFIRYNLWVMFKRLLVTDVKESVLWLLGNIFKYNGNAFFVHLL